MKKVITVGVYDYFHIGHLKLFKNAKKLGDYLIVAVQDGDCILKTKPDAKVLYTTEQRIEIGVVLAGAAQVAVHAQGRVAADLPQLHDGGKDLRPAPVHALIAQDVVHPREP